MTRIAVIIVNWNGKKDTIDCLASLGKLKTQSSKLKTYVVDNGSTDGSVEAIRKGFSDVVILETGKNLGFTGGNNIGIRQALLGGADFVWLLNNDTTVDQSALTELIAAFEDPNVGIGGSKIYFAPGREYHRDWYKQKDRGHVFWYAGGQIDWNNMYASHRGVDEVDHGQYDRTQETPFVTGCSMMVRKEVFDKVGYLDEKFFAYLEDLNFCLRAKQSGYKLLYVPKSVVWHNNAGSSSVGSSTHQYYMTRNRLFVGLRYAPLRTKFALVREAVRAVIAGPAVCRRAVLDAIIGRAGKP